MYSATLPNRCRHARDIGHIAHRLPPRGAQVFAGPAVLPRLTSSKPSVWNATKGRLYGRHGETHEITRVSRVESGSPASGSRHVHDQEKAQLFSEAFVGLG